MRALIVFAVCACTKAEPPKDPDPIPAPTPPVPAPPKTKERVLLVEGGAPAAVHYLVVRLSADATVAPKLDPLGARPALLHGTRSIATQDGEWWVHAIDGKRVVVGVMSSLSGGKPSYRIEVPVEPKGLHLAGDALFVGSAQAVGWIDLAAPKPAYVELVQRTGFPDKAYDLFVRDGNRLVAIDDEVMPMYADWFALDPTNRPTKRLGDWKLPGVINGSYVHAALLPAAADAWTLYLAAPYGVLSGHGHDLAAVPIRGDKLVFDPDLTLQNRDGKTPIVEEHVGRGGGAKTTLLGGTDYTEWTGMTIARGANRVLLAAGKRGLISLPASFPAQGATATIVDLGGSVSDVRDVDGLVLALVTAQTTALVVLDPTATKVTARHDLGRVVDYFVR